MLQLPHVAQLVGDEVLGHLVERRAHEDERAQLVAVEPA